MSCVERQQQRHLSLTTIWNWKQFGGGGGEFDEWKFLSVLKFYVRATFNCYPTIKRVGNTYRFNWWHSCASKQDTVLTIEDYQMNTKIWLWWVKIHFTSNIILIEIPHMGRLMGSSNVNRRAHNMKWIMKQSTLCNLYKLYRKRTAPSISDNSEQNGEEVAGEWWLDWSNHRGGGRWLVRCNIQSLQSL